MKEALPCMLPRGAARALTLSLHSSRDEARKEVVCVTARRGSKGRLSVLSKSA